jgi:hypothetical protein
MQLAKSCCKSTYATRYAMKFARPLAMGVLELGLPSIFLITTKSFKKPLQGLLAPNVLGSMMGVALLAAKKLFWGRSSHLFKNIHF